MRGTLHVIILQAEESRKPSLCDLDVLQIPALGLDNGTAHFQCEGKKVHFFIIIMYIQIVFQVHGYTGSFPGTRLYRQFPGTRLYRQFSGYTVIHYTGSFPVKRITGSFPGTRLCMQFSGYTVIHAVFRVHGYTGCFSGYSVIQSVSQCQIVLQVLGHSQFLMG